MFNNNDGFTMPVMPAYYGNNGMFGFGDNGIWTLILFALIFGWGGNGFGLGGYGGGINSPAGQGYATRADINEGFAFNNLQRDVNSIQNGICDSTYALNNAITNGFSNNQLQLCNGFNGVQTQISNLGYQLSQCCCDIQRSTDGINYNIATQTNVLQNTMNNNARDIIESQNAGTRAILDYLCQDKISTLQAENQSLKFAASQQAQNAFITANQDAQTAEIIRRLGKDAPVPAYVVPNPNCCYGTPVGVMNNGSACNFGC